MKWNLMHVVWLIALTGLYFIYVHIKTLSESHFFGSAESDDIPVKTDFDGIVQEIRIKPGQSIRTGDTLIVLKVPEWEKRKNELLGQTEMAQWNQGMERMLYLQEKRIEETQYNLRKTELESRKAELLQEQTVQSELRSQLKLGATSQVGKNIELEWLDQQMENLKTEHLKKLENFDLQLRKKFGALDRSAAWIRDDLQYLQQKFTQLYICSKQSGMVSEFSMLQGDWVRSGSNLFNIISHQPTKIKGFLPEASDFSPVIGQKVALSSSVRPGVQDSGVVEYIYPKITELPVRLRRVPEIKSWGRELYILLDRHNPFFTGEKLRIDIIP